MAINRTSLSAQSIRENTDLTIEFLLTPPVSGQYLEAPVTPNVLYGFYNDVLDVVQLYVSDTTGYRLIRVG